MSLTFYHHPMSPPARSVRAFMILSNIAHQSKIIEIGKKGTRTDEFLKINPMGKIPVIEENGFILGESEAIVRYLLNTRKVPDHFYPSDVRERAVIDKYFPFYHSIFRPSLMKYFINTYPVLHRNLSYISVPSSKEEAKSATEAALRQFEEVFLGSKKYILGDNISIADLFTVNELTQIYFAANFDFNSLPVIKSYLERCREIPVIEELQKAPKEFPEQMRPYMEHMAKKKAAAAEAVATAERKQ